MEFDINNEKIQIKRNGEIVNCDVLFTFDSEDTMKNYIGYTDHSFASNGRMNIFVSAYNPLKAKIQLEDITDKRELQMINEVLNKIDSENA